MLLWMTAACACLPAQEQPQPLRVAIVGLAHDHVVGFLGQLPQHHEVELVGIAEADSSLIAKYQKKFNLAETLFSRAKPT